MKIRIGLEGMGAALLLLFSDYLLFFHPQNHALYHHGLPVTNMIGGLLVDLLAIALLAAGYIFAIRHLRQPTQRILEALFAGIMLWGIVDFGIQVLIFASLPTIFWGHYWERFHELIPISSWEHIWRRCLLVLLLLSGVVARFLPRFTQPVVCAIRVTVAAFAFSAIWILPQLIHLALLQPPAFAPPPAMAQGSPHQRIIWILFDELSYDQAFEHPAAGIRLPNFDRLRAESFSFSNLRPIGYETNRIIPSLLLGRQFEEFRGTTRGELWYFDKSQHRWRAYDPKETLFALAQSNGWNTGADGWYIPYCRVIGSVLNACYWTPNDIFPLEEYGASKDHSVLANAAAVPRQMLAGMTAQNTTAAEEHLAQHRSVMAHTAELIDDTRLNFVFLHLPVPHPPGIYDRQRHMLCPGGTYLDNLVLADETLGALVREIDATPLAGQTTIIVSSDHSWRIPMWRPLEDWSAEEERASGGSFDDRPVLLIHLPGQQSGSDIHAATSEMIEHDVIAAMLRGEVNNPDALQAYLAQSSH
jgi:hypothetical protein